LTVVFGNTIDAAVNERVRRFCTYVENCQSGAPWEKGIGEVVPCFCSALVNYRPEYLPYKEALALVRSLAETSLAADQPNDPRPNDPRSHDQGTHAVGGRILHIPCCYGGHFGPDMAFAEKHTGLSREEIISIHSGTDYRVYMLGFLPGFVYLGGLDPRIELPRLKTPRVKIPRGSVGIGGKQTGVYPMDSPGGWQLLGATPVEFYDPHREEPILCKAGDTIRFFPISSCDYYDIRQEILKGGKGWR